MKELVRETMDSLKEYLPKLIEATVQITENLQTEKDWDALNLIIKVTEGIEWSIKAINLVQNNFRNIGIETNSLSTTLLEINDALQIRDFVLTADLFEYEVNPILSTWLTKVNDFND